MDPSSPQIICDSLFKPAIYISGRSVDTINFHWKELIGFSSKIKAQDKKEKKKSSSFINSTNICVDWQRPVLTQPYSYSLKILHFQGNKCRLI